jgi:plastocyanin
MKRRLVVPTAAAITLAAAAAAVPALASGAGAQASSSHTVIIKNLAFNPKSLSIRRGDSVSWKWEDGSTPHNVTSTGFGHSKTQTSGTFTVRFSRSGTFSYRCTIHPFMTAKIVVH